MRSSQSEVRLNYSIIAITIAVIRLHPRVLILAALNDWFVEFKAFAKVQFKDRPDSSSVGASNNSPYAFKGSSRSWTAALAVHLPANCVRVSYQQKPPGVQPRRFHFSSACLAPQVGFKTNPHPKSSLYVRTYRYQ